MSSSQYVSDTLIYSSLSPSLCLSHTHTHTRMFAPSEVTDMLITFKVSLSLESHTDNAFLELISDIELIIFAFHNFFSFLAF